MTTFNIVTFNTFAVRSWTTNARVAAIARELYTLAPHVACMQEVHTHGARRLLEQATDRFPYAIHAFRRGRPLGGLLTLSQLPFVRTEFLPYHEQGPWYTLNLMDKLLYKGMLVAELRYAGARVIVVNTHLIANYGGKWERHHVAAQIQQVQLQQLAETVRDLPAGAMVLVMGDFNIPRRSWLYEEFVARSGLTDTMADDARATFRPLPGVPARFAQPIDFIFVRAPAQSALSWQCELTFTDKAPLLFGRQGHLSDHLGILARFAW